MGQYIPSGQKVEQELQNIAEALQTPNQALYLGMLYKAPVKPRDGMIVLADGSLWNPSGAGAGFYGYYAGSWKKLG